MFTIDHYSEQILLVHFTDEQKRLTILNAEKLKSEINEQIDMGAQNIVIDFGKIAFIDSSGFGAMVTIFNHARNHHSRLIFCNLRPETQSLLKITKLDQVFEIYQDAKLALDVLL